MDQDARPDARLSRNPVTVQSLDGYQGSRFQFSICILHFNPHFIRVIKEHQHLSGAAALLLGRRIDLGFAETIGQTNQRPAFVPSS
jgi:hypothetical protein